MVRAGQGSVAASYSFIGITSACTYRFLNGMMGSVTDTLNQSFYNKA